MNRVAFHTLGCKLNFTETSAVGRQFKDQGFIKTEFPGPADVYVVNTCSVTEQANKKCRRVIKQAMKANPDAFVIVIGCYAQLKPDEISNIPGVDAVLGAGDKFRIFEIIEDFTKTENPCVYNSEIKEVDQFIDAYSLGDRTRSFLKIQDGCDYKCSFCTIPLARGKSRSDHLPNILANARQLADQGIKEIVLTGVNIGDYGKDQPGTFLDVIKALDQLEEIERFRISSIEPNLLSNEIIAFVASSQRFMPHFHIPLQSGSNSLLRAMRRRYQRELYADRVSYIKSLMPEACIGVDVIVGFPGETDDLFEESYDFIHQLDVAYLHVFTYSERENTVAADLEGKIPVKARHERSQRLRMLSVKKRRHFYEQFTGSRRPVLFEKQNQEGKMFGFTDNYIKVVHPYEKEMKNTIHDVHLLSVDHEGHMRGECIQAKVIS